MVKVVVKSKTKKIKRKFPVTIVAPEHFGSKVLGTSNTTDLKSFTGKTVKINYMYVSGSVKNQNINLTFKVVEVSSGMAKTRFIGYSQVPYFLGRYVKSGSDLIENSFIVKSKDGFNLRVKPFIVTKNHVNSMIKTSIRNLVVDLIKKEAGKVLADDFMYSVLLYKFQNKCKTEVKKITPIKTFEFKKVLIES